MNNAVLACYDLTKSYNDGNTKIEVLKELTLEVIPGEIVAIVGSSGSGKSTLLHLLGGLDKPSKGKVLLNGNDMHKMSEIEKCETRNKYFGFVYQFHHLLPEFTALENVGMPLLLSGKHPKLIREQALEILRDVGLEKRTEHKLGQLSGGERQRVAIARALVTAPKCILADEPTGNLDPRNAERVLDLFFQLQQKHKSSVVMVTHDHSIAKHAQRMFRIEHGSLVVV